MTVGRPVEFDKEKVLNAAMSAFWSQGFEGTSLQELLQVTGLSKSSLYQAFGDKEDLFLLCLDQYTSSTKDKLLAQLSLSDSGLYFIKQVLLSAADEAKSRSLPKGCMIMNTATEFAQNNPVVSKYVNKGIEAFKFVFLTALKKAVAQREIPENSNLDQMAAFVVSSMSGIKSMVKAGAHKRDIENLVKFVMKSMN
ncbi:MAG: hypothetical protein COT74_00510 [Bdellovibrionales bacterium CG10_big_fil_rev_8_21_14_0_10_45_34]|nr:MAG: hypothetical protein COT74_00510 [Bdellovibrionales bacterium CG10_big_fil_rev_8_21_14_0_10_45_34]